jgi:sterol desaturase/sphingolipid hydroxylase (fatty acid hydroxylase superfamily)
MIRSLVPRLAYPIVALATALYLWHELSLPRGELGARYGLFVAAMVVALVLLEALWPLQARWRMTRRTFFRRDLPFLLIGAATIGAGNATASWFLLHHGFMPPTAWLSGLPIVPEAVLSLLITDGLWYGVHRACHEGRGWTGRWLWRMHAAHHLPGEVYVLMHAIAHPINTIVVRLLLTVPPWLLGVSPEALFVANVVTGVQGLVSHFNVDSRVGWLNRLLVGTELHRWHHAAGVNGNYAAVLSIWDQLFGSFVYRPGLDPKRLGVEDPQRHPHATEIAKVLLEPLGWVRARP